MTITFNIRNVANGRKNTIMMRKFFQMVFLDNDRKSLHIYTATVLGGKHGQEKQDYVNKYFKSELDKFDGYCVQFDFIVTGNDNNDVLSISNEDVTKGQKEQNNGFLDQIDCIQQVWGKQSEILFGDQYKLQAYLTKLGQRDQEDNNQNKSEPARDEEYNGAEMAQRHILWIRDKNKSNEINMDGIAIPGKFRTKDYCVPPKKHQKKREKQVIDEGSEKAYYCVTVPDAMKCHGGIELLNWVKTTIVFEQRLNDPNLNFCIKKDLDENTSFLAPDFTWYFSPPVKSYINYESSSVEASWRKQDDKICKQHNACNCPVRPDIAAQYTSKRYDNAINPVANKTTVNFNRWVDDEQISYRQKYRIAAKNIFPQPKSVDDIRELNIFIDTSDEHNRGNRQYVLGLLISFALAFGIDKSRLEAAQKYFPFKEFLLADTWWLFLIITLSLNVLIWPPRNMEKYKYRKYMFWKKTNILCSLGWILFAFSLDQSKVIKEVSYHFLGAPIASFIESLLAVDVNFYWIPRLILIVILASNVIYIWKNVRKYHDPILSGIWGDDIL